MAQEDKRKRRKAAMLTCSGVVFLLAAAAAGLIFACLDLPSQPQRQADGSTLSFLGITTPDQPELLTGPPLFRLLAPLLPDNQRTSLGVRRFTHTHGALALWLHRQNRIVAFAPGATLIMPFDLEHRATIADENGHLAAPWGFDYDPQTFEFDPLLPRAALSTFPRRGRELTVRIYPEPETPGQEPIATFRLSNPYYRDYPRWTPQRLPVRQSAGDLDVELRTLRTGLPFGEGKNDPPGLSTHAVVFLRPNGKLTDDWLPGRVWVRDATGNSWDGMENHERLGKGRFKVLIQGNLWEEPAWKLNFRFIRVNGFPRSKACEISAVLPKEGRGPGPSTTAKIDGMTLRIEKMLQGNSMMRLPHGDHHTAFVSEVIVRLEGLARDGSLRLVGVSGPGYRWVGSREGTPLAPRLRSFMMPAGAEAGRFRLRFGMLETRETVFTVRPEPARDSN